MHLLLVTLLSLATPFVNPPQQPDWRAYSSAEGRFSVALPDEPKTAIITTGTVKGPLFTHTVSATDKELNEYMVSWTPYEHGVEEKGTESTFDRVRDALIFSKGGKLVSESAISLMGRKARAVTFTDSDGRVIMARFYFIDNCFYQVMAESRSKQNSADSSRFLQSFTVQAR